MHEFVKNAAEGNFKFPVGNAMHNNMTVYQKGNHQVKPNMTKPSETWPRSKPTPPE